jgi:hypothetical protein
MTYHGRQTGWTVDQALAAQGLAYQGLGYFAPNSDAAPPPGQTFTWVGGAGNNGSWTDAQDWHPASVPGATASVVFDTGSPNGYTVSGNDTISAITISGDNVTFDGTVTESSKGAEFFLNVGDDGQLTIDQNGSVTGEAINMTGGTLLTVEGSLIATYIYADSVIVEGLSGQLVTSATAYINQLYVQDGGSFTGNVSINNGGSIYLDTSSNFGGSLVTMVGSGLIYLSAAPETSGGQAGFGDNIATAANAYLTLGADPGVTLTIGGVISGGSALLVQGGTVELAGINTYTGFTEAMDGGTLQVDGPGSIASDLIFLSDGGFVNEASSTPYSDTVVAGGSSDTVDALGGGLLVFAGTSGVLNFVGGATASTVLGGAGILYATGGSAGDLIFGGTSGHDVMYTGAGNSTLVGGAGASLYADGAGSAVLVAGGANVLADASQDTGNVTVFGAAGDAISVSGGAGTLTAVVNDANASIYGGHGTADVFAGGGSLSLDYVVGFGGGTSNVFGFNSASDLISLFGYAAGAAQQALDSETVSGGNTYLELADQTHINLFGVTNLTMANFTMAPT